MSEPRLYDLTYYTQHPNRNELITQIYFLSFRVLSLGEASSGYLISTGENELGVVIARSEMSGVKMVPVSWTEMQCPKTYNKEFRKIAKVIPEELDDAF